MRISHQAQSTNFRTHRTIWIWSKEGRNYKIMARIKDTQTKQATGILTTLTWIWPTLSILCSTGTRGSSTQDLEGLCLNLFRRSSTITSQPISQSHSTTFLSTRLILKNRPIWCSNSSCITRRYRRTTKCIISSWWSWMGSTTQIRWAGAARRS